MRRVNLEIKNLGKMGADSFFEKIKELEVIRSLRSDPEGLTGIWRVILKNPKASPRTLLHSTGPGWWARISRMKVLSNDPEGWVIYAEIRPDRAGHGRLPSIHIISVEFMNGKVNITVLGDTAQLRRLLQRMTADGLDFRVKDVSDAKFEPTSPLWSLTVRQREVLLAAFESGYYDLPRRIGSNDLGVKLGLDKSTVGEHLRKAELSMMSRIIGKTAKRARV